MVKRGRVLCFASFGDDCLVTSSIFEPSYKVWLPTRHAAGFGLGFWALQVKRLWENDSTSQRLVFGGQAKSNPNNPKHTLTGRC